MKRVTMICVVLVLLGPRYGALALGNPALDRIGAACESKIFTLKVDLHEPETTGESMQAPTLENRGWHHHNPTGPVAIDAGSQVEVTGVYNYSERGFFLELARTAGGFGGDIASRARCRIRIVVEAPPSDQAAQAREALQLIGKVLSGVLDGAPGVE